VGDLVSGIDCCPDLIDRGWHCGRIRVLHHRRLVFPVDDAGTWIDREGMKQWGRDDNIGEFGVQNSRESDDVPGRDDITTRGLSFPGPCVFISTEDQSRKGNDGW
jgi:hypothetical protein